MNSPDRRHLALLFDIDGTLITPADMGSFTDTGMTDPEVGRKTFEAVLGRKPERHEFARLLERRLHCLRQTVNESGQYRVLPGVEDLLPRLVDQGYLVGLITGNLEAAAHIKLGPVVPPAESGQWPSPFLDAKVVSCDFLSRVRVGLYRGLRHPTT